MMSKLGKKVKVTTSEVRMRKCLLTGEKLPASEMVRFVLSPDGIITPDVAAKLPGRGCWLKADKKTLDQAIKKNLFLRFGHKVLSIKDKTLKKAQDIEELDGENPEDLIKETKNKGRKVTVDKALAQLVENLLYARVLDFIGLANRGGYVISGYEKVKSALMADAAQAILSASDASVDGRRKLLGGRKTDEQEEIRVIDIFTREELSLKLGLGNAVHVGLLSGNIVDNIISEVKRLEGYRNM